MKYARYHLWNADREYQGVTLLQGCTLPRSPYYLAMETPECPSPPEPEYPDGWYLVTFDRNTSTNLVREKKGDWAHDERGDETSRLWNAYTVVASLGDVKFLDGRGE
jgi:hypothetical protein